MRNRRSGLMGLACVIWICVILGFAVQGGDASHSLSTSIASALGRIMIPDFGTWSVDTQNNWVSGMEDLIRKSAHFVEFTVLGLMAYHFVSGVLKAIRRRKPVTSLQSGFAAFCLCALIATASELVQIIVVNRTAGTADVALDCCGIFLGIFLAIYRSERRGYRESAEMPVTGRHRKG